MYRREIDSEWLGPVKVVGQLGKTVIVMHGGQLIKLHSSKVRLRDEQCSSRPEQVVQPTCFRTREAEEVNVRTSSQRHDVNDSEADNSDAEDATREEEVLSEDVQPEDEVVTEDLQQDIIPVQGPEDSPREQGITVAEERASSTQTSEARTWDEVKRSRGNCVLRAGDTIRYREGDDDDDFTEAVITSRSGKASGEYKNRYNVTDSEKEYRVDLDKVKEVQQLVGTAEEQVTERVDEVAVEATEEAEVTEGSEDRVTDEELVIRSTADEEVAMFALEENICAVMIPRNRFKEEGVIAAMQTELESLKGFNAFEEVREVGQTCLSMRWIITEKSGGKFKARLVCRGFEEDTEFEVDSPTVDKSSVRVHLALSGIFKWNINSADIKAAFLQSDEIDRCVFVKPPANVKKQGIVWKLKKPLYGLNDSSRNWYFTLKKKLEETGFQMCSSDKALFYERVNKLEGTIVVHVDDLMYAGTGSFLMRMKELFRHFKLSKSDAGVCKYIGLDISTTDDGILLEQTKYAELIQPIQLSQARRYQSDETVTKEERTQYLSLLGKLNWLSCNSRPDLKFEVFLYSQYREPTVKQLMELNSVAKRVQKSSSKILYPRLDLQKLRLAVFSDASLGNLDNKVKSCKAFVTFLADGERCCPLQWNSKKIDRVCSDTLEAETRAMKYGLIHAVALRNMLKEILGFELPIHSYIDSKTLERACFSTKNVTDPILRRDVSRIQQMLQKGEITKVTHVSSKDQLADALTKKGVNPVKLLSVLETGKLSL